MKNFETPLAITMGDPSGIGPEIILKSIIETRLNNFVIFGDSLVFDSLIKSLGLPLTINKISELSEAVFEEDYINLFETSKLNHLPHYGKISKECGKASFDAIMKSIELAKQGKVSGIVTAPISKKALNLAHINYPGHTEILAGYSNNKAVSMMLLNKHIKTVLVTLHCSMKQALDRITIQNELDAIINADLGCKLFGIEKPVIAVAALNPHAGENGLFGNEEKNIIEPAIKLAQDMGINAIGPFPGDTVFMNAKNGKYDIVVSQYHDQGLIPIKYEGIDEGVNVTIGIDFLRTSPDHGTAFDIAGKNIASAKSFINSIHTIKALQKVGKSPLK